MVQWAYNHNTLHRIQNLQPQCPQMRNIIKGLKPAGKGLYNCNNLGPKALNYSGNPPSRFSNASLAWEVYTKYFIWEIINSVSLFVSVSVEVLKLRSLLIKLSPQTRGPKNYSELRVLTFYFYVRFRAATAVVDGGGIFGIWRVGEEIWVRFFWAKGLGGSWFLFFSWRGEGVGVGF